MHKDRAPRTMIFLAVAAFPIVPKTLYGAARLCHRHTWIIYRYQRLRPQPKPLEGGLTRYISTRGEAPELGFCDVMLTGLARDGGLYVPVTWPQLSAETIASFFGRPYWEVAVDVIRPFVGGEISDADLGRMANEAYATFRHPAVVPLDQIGPNQFLLELFHGPTLAFKDVAMQLISRLMDHVLAKRAQRITIVVATSGDTGTSAVALGAPAPSVDFTVPTGNFGDIFAGYVAKRMGLPVRWLRIAANVNDILPRTLKTGIYEVRDVHATTSPSMDIQVSSNFERLLFEASGRDAGTVRRLMASLN